MRCSPSSSRTTCLTTTPWVLSIIVSDYLFNNYTVPEGELTKLRAAIVCEKSLDVMANKIGLGQYLRLGHGEELTGGRTRPSIIADAFEALIAAIYLDSGIESARKFVLPFVTEMLEHEDSLSFKDYKTILQEITPLRIIRPSCRRSSSRTRRKSWSISWWARRAPTMTSAFWWMSCSTPTSSAGARAEARKTPSRWQPKKRSS